MKKIVIARSYSPYMSKLLFNEDFFFAVEKSFDSKWDPDLVILNRPTLRETAYEIGYRAEKSRKYKIGIITEISRIRMLDSMFSDIDFILSNDEYGIEKEVRNLLEKRCMKESSMISFTDMESEFLQNLAYGMNMQEVTLSMNITDRSARRLKEKLLKKTGLFSLQQLSIYALVSDKINTRSC